MSLLHIPARRMLRMWSKQKSIHAALRRPETMKMFGVPPSGSAFRRFVWSSAFRRSVSMIRVNRLKAELQTNRLKAELQTNRLKAELQTNRLKAELQTVFRRSRSCRG